MKLSFWYLIAPGGEGDFRLHVYQYKDSPNNWVQIHAAAIEQTYCRLGCWVKVERIFRTEPDATSLVVEFRIHDSNIGEAWIDDVKLEPLDQAPKGP
jgi:hypothetical protein